MTVSKASRFPFGNLHPPLEAGTHRTHPPGPHLLPSQRSPCSGPRVTWPPIAAPSGTASAHRTAPQPPAPLPLEPLIGGETGEHVTSSQWGGGSGRAALRV